MSGIDTDGGAGDWDAAALVEGLARVDEAMRAHRDGLCELDGAIGDADHGVTMTAGFKAVRAALDEPDAAPDPTAALNAAAKAFLNAVGASAGPLYATALMRAGAALKGRERIDAGGAGALVAAMAEGVAARGKAEAGDKTMLDAWGPAAEAAARAAAAPGATVADVLDAAAGAAEAGARRTVDMQARKGRSAKLGERSVGHMDAGAASAALALRALAGRGAVELPARTPSG